VVRQTIDTVRIYVWFRGTFVDLLMPAASTFGERGTEVRSYSVGLIRQIRSSKPSSMGRKEDVTLAPDAIANYLPDADSIPADILSRNSKHFCFDSQAPILVSHPKRGVDVFLGLCAMSVVKSLAVHRVGRPHSKSITQTRRPVYSVRFEEAFPCSIELVASLVTGTQFAQALVLLPLLLLQSCNSGADDLPVGGEPADRQAIG
jgi:hypothetical protein